MVIFVLVLCIILFLYLYTVLGDAENFKQANPLMVDFFIE